MFYPFSKQLREQRWRVCCASLPYAKRWRSETKGVHEHQLDVWEERALACTRPLLTQCTVFIAWWMRKDSKSQSGVKDVTQCDLNLSSQRPNCKFSEVSKQSLYIQFCVSLCSQGSRCATWCTVNLSYVCINNQEEGWSGINPFRAIEKSHKIFSVEGRNITVFPETVKI